MEEKWTFVADEETLVEIQKVVQFYQVITRKITFYTITACCGRLLVFICH